MDVMVDRMALVGAFLAVECRIIFLLSVNGSKVVMISH